MTGSLAVKLTEVADVLQADVVAGKMEPCIKKHAAVTCGKGESIAIDPIRVRRIQREGMPEEDGSNLSGPQRESEMTSTAGVYGVYGKPPGLCGSLLEDNFIEVAHKGMDCNKTT